MQASRFCNTFVQCAYNHHTYCCTYTLMMLLLCWRNTTYADRGVSHVHTSHQYDTHILNLAPRRKAIVMMMMTCIERYKYISSSAQASLTSLRFACMCVGQICTFTHTSIHSGCYRGNGLSLNCFECYYYIIIIKYYYLYFYTYKVSIPNLHYTYGC